MATSKSYILFGGDVALWSDGETIMLKTCDPHGDAVELSAEQATRLSRLLLKLASSSPESQ